MAWVETPTAASLAAPPSERAAELARYFAVSLGALAVDGAALFALVEAGLPVLAANAASFTLGAVVAYLGSIRWVFARRRLSDRNMEFAVFAGVGVAGLAVNEAALWIGAAALGLPLPLAKLSAAGASFLFNYGVRRAILFR